MQRLKVRLTENQTELGSFFFYLEMHGFLQDIIITSQRFIYCYIFTALLIKTQACQ